MFKTPIAIADDFDEPMPEIWEALANDSVGHACLVVTPQSKSVIQIKHKR